MIEIIGAIKMIRIKRINSIVADGESRLKAICLVSLVSSLMVACATSGTAYTVASKRGDYGYSERKLTETRYRVSFTGNSNTPVDLVQDYALLRAAELTVQKNHDWFEIADRATTPQVAPDAVDTEVAIAAGGPTHTKCGLLGCSTTRYSPAYSMETIEFPNRRQRYTASIEVVMGSGNSVGATSGYDARELIESLRADI